MQILEEIQKFLEKCKEDDKKPLVSILGPTASGKTDLSIEIAKRFNGEVISADSRQVYKYMDIGTAKITQAEMQGIKHHMLDVVDPSSEFTLADYKRKGIKAINEVHLRQKLPILCGGTGLYFNAIIENYQIPQVPPQYDLRQKLAQYYEENGAEALHKILEEHDPETAKEIHPNNVRYVIRAIEICTTNGGKKVDKKGEKMFEAFNIGIDWPRDILYERINKRVHVQIEKGLLNEVKTLLMKGYNEKYPSISSLGYLELIEFLKGDVTMEQAIENIQKNTRNYCKRQQTWFRRYKDIHWVKGSEIEEYFKK